MPLSDAEQAQITDELEAMSQLTTLLDDLPTATAIRIIGWAQQRFADKLTREGVIAPPPPAA